MTRTQSVRSLAGTSPGPISASNLPPSSELGSRLLLLLSSVYAAVTIASNATSHLHFASTQKILSAPFILLAIVKYRSRVKTSLNWVFASFFAIAVLELASVYWSIVPSTSASHATVFLFVLAGCVAELLTLKNFGRKAIRALSLGMMVGGELLAILVLWAEKNHTYAASEALAQRVSAGSANPNDVAIILAMVTPLFLFEKRASTRLLAIPLIVAGMLTGSRTGILCLVPAVFGVLLIPTLLGHAEASRRRLNRRIVLQSAAVLVVATVVAVRTLPASVLHRLSSLASQFNGGTFTGRTILWKTAWQGFLTRPLQGYGSGSSPAFEFRHSGFYLVTHDTFLAFGLEIGLAGVVLFAIAYLTVLRGGLRHVREFPWYLVMVAVITVGMTATAWDYNKVLWLVFVIGGFLASVSKGSLDEAEEQT